MEPNDIFIEKIFPLNPPIVVGINNVGQFIARFSNDDIRIIDAGLSVYLLPLLEIPFSEFNKTIEEMKRNFGVNSQVNITPVFPYKEIINSALSSNREYWVDLSLNWLVSYGKLNFLSELNTQIANKQLSQKMRHKLMKL